MDASQIVNRPTYRSVDFAVKIRVNPEQTGIDLNVKHSMVRHSSASTRFVHVNRVQNPFDEIGAPP